MAYSEHVVEDGWEPAPWPPEVRACDMTGLRVVVYATIGAAAIAAALALAILNRSRGNGARSRGDGT